MNAPDPDWTTQAVAVTLAEHIVADTARRFATGVTVHPANDEGHDWLSALPSTDTKTADVATVLDTLTVRPCSCCETGIEAAFPDTETGRAHGWIAEDLVTAVAHQLIGTPWEIPYTCEIGRWPGGNLATLTW